MKTLCKLIAAVAAAMLTTTLQAQNPDVTIGPAYYLKLQRQNNQADAFILHNAEYDSGDDVLKYTTTHASFGMRGIRFSYYTNRGIYFYADDTPTTAGATFQPKTRLFIGNTGNVGVGTITPVFPLEVKGDVNLEDDGANNADLKIRLHQKAAMTYFNTRNSPTPILYINRNWSSSTSYYSDFNTVAIYGNVGIGTTTPAAMLHVNGRFQVSNQWMDQYANNTPGIGHGSNGTGLYLGALSVGYDYGTLGTSMDNTTNAFIAGKMAIGTTDIPGSHSLYVNGSIVSTEVNVKLKSGWPDDVFDSTYQLLPLAELRHYIDEHKHLPDVPSAKEVEADGVNVGEMNRILLKKIEELTLHVIELNNTVNLQRKEIDALKNR